MSIQVRVGQVVTFTNVLMNFHYPEQTCGPVASTFTVYVAGTGTATPSAAGDYGYECGAHGAPYAGTLRVVP